MINGIASGRRVDAPLSPGSPVGRARLERRTGDDVLSRRTSDAAAGPAGFARVQANPASEASSGGSLPPMTTVGLEEDSTSERTSTAALIEACHAAALTPPVPGEPVGTIDAILDRLDAAGDGALWSVFLLDHGRLWAIAQRGYTMLPDGLPLDRGVMARALRDGRTQLVADVTADPDYVAGARGVVSELVVPVRSGGTIVGALNVETTTPLSGEEAVALEALSDSLGAPLAELRDSPALDLSSLARLFVHMSSLRDAGSIADLAARSLAHVLGLDAAAVIVGAVAAGGSCARDGVAKATRRRRPSSSSGCDGLVDTAAVLDVVDVDSGGLGSLAGAARTARLAAAARERGRGRRARRHRLRDALLAATPGRGGSAAGRAGRVLDRRRALARSRAARGRDRRADGAAQPARLRRRARARARPGRRGQRARSASSCSTATTSSRSTTVAATSAATGCWPRSAS